MQGLLHKGLKYIGTTTGKKGSLNINSIVFYNITFKLKLALYLKKTHINMKVVT